LGSVEEGGGRWELVVAWFQVVVMAVAICWLTHLTLSKRRRQ